MPTVAREGPYRLYFFSNEGREPPHVHVERDRGRRTAKFWIAPVRLAHVERFTAVELSTIMSIVQRCESQIGRAWREHFGE